MEKKEIIRKLLLGPLDWITLAPFLAGISVGLGAWAVGQDSGIVVASSVMLVLASAGIYLNRLLFGWQENYEKIVATWRDAVEKARDAELDRLYRELAQDGDPRTEALLKDLRTLTKALMNEQSETLAMSAFDIVSDVDKLFQRSVDYLQESLNLWQTAEDMERASIKEQLMAQRDVLIGEVEQSLENLGDVLGSVKRAAVSTHDGQRLADLREELTARLKIAEDVEERMSAMRRSTTPAQDEEKYLQYAGN
jgi:hypothetical protein